MFKSKLLTPVSAVQVDVKNTFARKSSDIVFFFFSTTFTRMKLWFSRQRNVKKIVAIERCGEKMFKMSTKNLKNRASPLNIAAVSVFQR